MQVAQTIKLATFLPNSHNLDQLFETPQKKTVIQLRWPLVILSCYLLLYSPGDWLYASQIQAIAVFYLLTNVTLYCVAEDHFNWAKFYGPLLLFDTFFLALTLGLSGGTTPDLVVACLFTLILSCVCNDPRGLLVISIFYGYFAQVERQKQLAIDKEQQADGELKTAEEVRRQRARLEVLYEVNP